MVSVFPALLAFSLPAIFLLRVTAGFFFLLFGMRLMQASHSVKRHGVVLRIVGYLYGLSKCAVGIMLIVGTYTQVAALFGMALSALTLAQGVSTRTSSSSQQVQILLFVLCFSLLFLGPGYFSFDLPL